MSSKREAVNPPGNIQINKILILFILTYYVTIVESRALKQEMCPPMLGRLYMTVLKEHKAP